MLVATKICHPLSLSHTYTFSHTAENEPFPQITFPRKVSNLDLHLWKPIPSHSHPSLSYPNSLILPIVFLFLFVLSVDEPQSLVLHLSFLHLVHLCLSPILPINNFSAHLPGPFHSFIHTHPQAHRLLNPHSLQSHEHPRLLWRRCLPQLPRPHR